MVDGGGDGAVKELAELRCWWCEAPVYGEGGAKCEVGVGVGVFWFDCVGAVGVAFGGPTSPLYVSPSSPAANAIVEQNPSDEDTTSVSPSLDLNYVSGPCSCEKKGAEKRETNHARSVKVAQWRLLTMQMGVFCCESYRRTESCVATAYTTRYGSENAGLGPGVDELVSTDRGFEAA